jgi:hypothetical protein
MGRQYQTLVTNTVIITLRFTESDHSCDYSNFADGYHIGARSR